MTRPLRRAHFYIWIGLTVALVGLIAASLALRMSPTPANAAFEWRQFR